ncbi:MAG: ABC transporter ATP-binding protein [Gemmatimonadaceae bacterium]
MARVTLDGVRKVYDGGEVAVHGIDLEVGDGELVVLVGPSGCGKSTTLRMIAGLESITDGRLLIGDRLVNDVPPASRDIAMVFQTYALYPHMSVRENMAFALRLRKLPAAEIERRVADAAEMLGLEPVLDRTPRQLSGGQRQRVAIGRAIVRQPAVFLFDEPLSNLDAKLRVQTRREIARLQRRLGVTSVYVTHDQTEAMTMGDRIVVMNAGRVQQVDTPLALYERPRNLFVATFIGSPAMNLLRGRVEAGGGDGAVFRAGEVTLPLTAAQVRRLAGPAGGANGRPLVAGVRPEHVHLADPPAGARALAGFRVDVVEPLGSEVLLHARAASGQELTAALRPQPIPAPGEAVTLAVDAARLHFFDEGTGEAIGE